MTCPRCSGAMVKGYSRGEVYPSCLACGYEDSRAQRDPAYAEELRRECEARGKHARKTLERYELPTYQERAIRSLVGER